MEINFAPYPIQYEAWKYLWDKTSTQIFFGGAVRVSKSYLLCAWATYYCLSFPNIHGAICRSRLSRLKTTTIQTLMEFFRHNEIREGFIDGERKNDKNYNFNRQDMILTFNNGSKIFFLELYNNPSDPNYDRIMSLSLTFAAVDEVSEIKDTAINILQTRLSHMLKEYDLIPKLLLVSNPNRGWLYYDYYKPFIENRLPNYRKVVLGLPKDNLSLSQKYIDNLETVLTDVNKSRLLYGNWEYSDDEFALIKYDDILQSFYNIVPPGMKYLSCDVANIGNDKTVIGIWNGLELIKIYSYSKKDTIQVVKLIKEKMEIFKVPIKNVVIDADGLGIGVSDHLKGCVPFKGGSKALNNENYKNLRSQCYFKIKDTILNMKLPEENKDEIIQELQSVRMSNLDTDNKTQIESKDKIKERIRRSPDFGDMIMMRMYFEYKTDMSFRFII